MDETQRILERARQREAELSNENNSYLPGGVYEVVIGDKVRLGNSVDRKDDLLGIDDPEMDTEGQPDPNKENMKRRSSLYPCEEIEELRRDALREANNVENANLNTDASSVEHPSRFTKSGMRSRFAALSAELEEFECEQKPTQRSKDSYVNGASPRLDTGETRPSALFTPTATYYPTAKEMKHSPHNASRSSTTKPDASEMPKDADKKEAAEVDENTKPAIKDDNSVSASSGKVISTSVAITKLAEKQTRFASPVCEIKSFSSTGKSSASSFGNSNAKGKCPSITIKASVLEKEESCNFSGHEIQKRESEEYGIHNFFKRKMPEVKKVVLEERNCPDDVQQINHDPQDAAVILEPPMSSSTPKDPSGEISPIRNEQKNTLTLTRGDIVDEITAEAKKATAALDMEPSDCGRAKLIAKKLEQKMKDETESVKKPKVVSSPGRLLVTPSPKTPNIGTRINWRTNNATKTPKSVRIDIRSADVKKLRNRWEVSSATGTPLHPDQKADELMEAAVRMSRSMNQAKIWNAKTIILMDADERGVDNSASNTPSEKFGREPDPKQPKSVTETNNGVEVSNSNVANDGKVEVAEESKGGMPIPVVDTSETREPDQVIDDLFNFINETPNRNSSLLSAMMSTPEMHTPDTSAPAALLDAGNTEENLPLAHSVSFYRKKKKQIRHTGETIVLGQFTSSPPQESPSPSPHSALPEGERFEKERRRLEQAISVQEKQVAQATRALHFCRNTEEFRGSREQVDAQRALLIATERRRALIFQLDRMNQAKAIATGERLSLGPKGTLTISHISVKLMRDFINGHINYHSDQLLFYFIVLIRYGETVLHTTMTTSDQGLKSGKLEFPHYIQLKSLPHDFSCLLEVYALRTQRELLEHHEKYRIKGSTMKRSAKSPMLNAAFSSSPGCPSAEVDPSFQLVGSLTLNIGSLRKSKFQLVDPMSPLDGAIEMNLRCYAEGTGTIGHKAFLSLYQDVENMASWTRFWCVLSEGQLRFWRYPEDESIKAPVVSIDLRTCACNEIKAIPVESCPYPNSMQVDVWVPSENQGKRDKIRVLMAADRKDEMLTWLKVMNGSLKNLTLWNPGH